MKKVLTYSILLIILISAFSFAQDTNEKADKAKIQSTEGLEVTKSDENSIINSKTDNKEAKQKTKNRKKLLRYISKIERYEEKKRIKERDKDFLENRLNKKKNNRTISNTKKNHLNLKDKNKFEKKNNNNKK